MNAISAFAFRFRGALVPLMLIPSLLLPVEARSAIHYLLGFLLIAGGVGFRLSGIRHIGRKAHVHTAKSRGLCTAGVYGRVRNPLYLGNILVALGLLALYLSLTGVVVTATLLFTLYTLVIMHEERALAAQLGPPYQQYLEEVPRWIFRFKPSTFDGPDQTTPVPWLEVARLERWFILSAVLLGALSPIVWGLNLKTALSLPPFLQANLGLLLASALLVVCGYLFARVSTK